MSQNDGPTFAQSGARLKPWSAAQALSWIIMGVPLGMRNWDSRMSPMPERAQMKLRRAIGAERAKAWGCPAPHQPHELIPSEQFRIPNLVLVVNPLGGLATLPPHKFVTTYAGPHWTDITFDAVEIKPAFPRPLSGPQPEPPPPTPTAVKRKAAAAQANHRQGGGESRRGG